MIILGRLCRFKHSLVSLTHLLCCVFLVSNNLFLFCNRVEIILEVAKRRVDI